MCHSIWNSIKPHIQFVLLFSNASPTQQLIPFVSRPKRDQNISQLFSNYILLFHEVYLLGMPLCVALLFFNTLIPFDPHSIINSVCKCSSLVRKVASVLAKGIRLTALETEGLYLHRLNTAQGAAVQAFPMLP